MSQVDYSIHNKKMQAERGPDTSNQLRIVNKKDFPLGHIGFCGTSIILREGRYYLNGKYFNVPKETIFENLDHVKNFISTQLFALY